MIMKSYLLKMDWIAFRRRNSRLADQVPEHDKYSSGSCRVERQFRRSRLLEGRHRLRGHVAPGQRERPPGLWQSLSFRPRLSDWRLRSFVPFFAGYRAATVTQTGLAG